jgi:phage FluMu protein gp41
MSKKPDFVIVDGKAVGQIKHGFIIGGQAHKDFVLRESTVEDLLDAELLADVTKPLNFAAQLMVRQLEQVGGFDGPVTIGMIRKLKPADWRILRDAQTKVDALGEDEPGSSEES